MKRRDERSGLRRTFVVSYFLMVFCAPQDAGRHRPRLELQAPFAWALLAVASFALTSFAAVRLARRP